MLPDGAAASVPALLALRAAGLWERALSVVKGPHLYPLDYYRYEFSNH